jgi:hypothetical protein
VLRSGWERFYSDFLLPDRLPEYRRLLEEALALGYLPHSIGSYQEAAYSGIAPGARLLIVRHDIDTDVGTAREKWRIERELGVRASYFFRLSTVDVPFMRDLAAGGSEVGYHFEEIATLAKERRLRMRSEVEAHLPEIRARFRGNLQALRRQTGLPIRTVAAHGDMANRVLGMKNQELLDVDMRAELDIDAEVYDRELRAGVTSHFSDAPYPRFWTPYDASAALRRGDAVVSILTHPRHWRRNVRENMRDDAWRLVAELRYRRWRRPVSDPRPAQLIFRQTLSRGFDVAPVPGASFHLLSAPGDAWGMRRMLWSSLGTTEFAKSLARLATSSRRLYCVVQDGRIVHRGSLLVSRSDLYPVAPGDVVIGPIRTDAAARGRGLAAFGLQSAMNALLGCGHTTFVINTTPDNEAARRVIATCGFGSPVATRPAAGACGDQ